MSNSDATTVIQNLRKVYNYFVSIEHTTYAGYINDAINSINECSWISVNSRMPQEYDSVFAKLKDTTYWSDSMYQKKSEDVRVVCELEDHSTQIVTHSYTVDGQWRIENGPQNQTRRVLYWMENPPLPNEE